MTWEKQWEEDSKEYLLDSVCPDDPYVPNYLAEEDNSDDYEDVDYKAYLDSVHH